MKKVFVGITALLVATGVALASDCTSGGKKCGCKPKKYRIVYVTAHNPDTMYDNSIFETAEVGPNYRMVPMERGSAMRERRATYEEDDRYYGPDYNDSYDDEYIEMRTATPRTAAAPRTATRNEADNYSTRDTRRSESRSNTRRNTSSWNGAYVGARVGVDLLHWKNKYSAEPETAIDDADADHDNYSFEPVFGGGVFAGLHLNPAWRADLEIAYLGKFSDSDNGFTFKLSSQHVTLNAYYDFINGFYLGAGLGVAFTKGELDWDWFVANSRTELKTSFVGAVMFGWSRYLNERIVLDLRGRVSGFGGPKWTRGVMQPEYQSASGSDLSEIGVKTGFIRDTALTVGVRFEF